MNQLSLVTVRDCIFHFCGEQTNIQTNALLNCIRSQHVLLPQTGKQNEPLVISLINAALTHFLNYPTELDVLTARDISAAFDMNIVFLLSFFFF